MTIAVVQNRAVSGALFTFAGTPSVGNVIVIAAMTNFGHVAPTGPTGFAGTTAGPNMAGGTADDYAGLWWKRYATGDTNSFAVGNLGGTFGTYGWEISGLATGSFLSSVGTNDGTAAGTASTVTAGGTVPTEDAFGVSVMAANALFTSPAVAGWGDCVKVINPGAVAWETFATQQTDVDAAWTWTNSVKPVQIAAVFQGTDTGVTPTPGSTIPGYLNVAGDWVPYVESVNISGSWS